MKNLFNKIKQTKKVLSDLLKEELDKKIATKCICFSLLIILMIMIPLLLIFIELFKQFSIVLPFTYFLLVLVFIFTLTIYPLYMLIYFEILKNYWDNELLHKLKAHDIFLCELFNPLYVFISLAVVVIIYLFLRGIL